MGANFGFEEEKRESYVVLLTEFLAERCAHDGAAHARRSREVRLARLSPGGVEACCHQHAGMICDDSNAYWC